MRSLIDKRYARISYYTCIHSKIKYGIELYGSAHANTLDKLQTIQNKLMKILTNKEYLYSTNKLHKDLNILKVSDIHRHSILQFVYKCKSGKQVSNFTNYFTTRGSQHTRTLRNNDELHPLTIDSELGRSTVHHIGSTLWNDTDERIKNSDSLNIFKNEIFKNIISSYTD